MTYIFKNLTKSKIRALFYIISSNKDFKKHIKPEEFTEDDGLLRGVQARNSYNNYVYTLYIEKDKTEDCLYIETESSRFKYRGNISQIENVLKEDKRFYKTHRSCIVNTFKITKIISTIPAIYFNDKFTNSLARDKRKELEEICMLEREFDYDEWL